MKTQQTCKKLLPNCKNTGLNSSHKDEITQTTKSLRSESGTGEEVPVSFYQIAAEKSLDINSQFEQIKEVFEKNKEIYAKSVANVDFSHTTLKPNTMLWTVYKTLDKIIGRAKQILAAYKKLFCYDHKKKEFIQNEEDSRVNKLQALGNVMLDTAFPFILETIVKVWESCNEYRKIMSRCM